MVSVMSFKYMKHSPQALLPKIRRRHTGTVIIPVYYMYICIGTEKRTLALRHLMQNLSEAKSCVQSEA